MTEKFREDKFSWGEGDFSIQMPPGQEPLIDRLKRVGTVTMLENIMPEVLFWIEKNPDDVAVSKALLEATKRV